MSPLQTRSERLARAVIGDGAAVRPWPEARAAAGEGPEPLIGRPR